MYKRKDYPHGKHIPLITIFNIKIIEKIYYRKTVLYLITV